jgi:hypothetical protein
MGIMIALREAVEESAMPISKKVIETLGGLGSILVGFVCVGIGLMDYQAGQGIWKVWLVMTLVLVGNGLAMLRHAAKRPTSDTQTIEVARART